MPVMSGNVASNKNSPQIRRSRTEQKNGRYTKGLDVEAGHPLKIVKRRRASSAPRWTHNRRQLVYRECCSTVAERLARLEVVDQLEKRRPPVCPLCDDSADGSQNCAGWCREIDPEKREKSARCLRHKIRRVQAFISREADTMRRYFRNVNRKWVVGSTSGLPSGVREMLRDSEDTVGQKDENFSAVQARPSAKILGELAFQLERRILDYVFGMEGSKRRRFYGYTVNNIYDMMEKESKNYKGDDDPSRKTELMSRLKRLLCGLKKVGYNIKVHGDFAQLVINRYGLLSCPPDSDTIKEFGLQDVKCISSLITQLARGQHEANNLQILLKGLKYLSKCDGGPLFIW